MVVVGGEIVGCKAGYLRTQHSEWADFAPSGEQVGECVGERIMKGLVGQVKGFIVISPEGPR